MPTPPGTTPPCRRRRRSGPRRRACRCGDARRIATVAGTVEGEPGRGPTIPPRPAGGAGRRRGRLVVVVPDSSASGSTGPCAAPPARCRPATVAGADGGPSPGRPWPPCSPPPGPGGEMAEHVLVEDRRPPAGRPPRGRLAATSCRCRSPTGPALAALSVDRIRLVWVPPPALGSLPIGLLPLDDRYRLLHGAIDHRRPPDLARLDRHPRSRGWRRAPVGGDRGPRCGRLTSATSGDMVGPEGLAVPPARVRRGRLPTCVGTHRSLGSPASPRTRARRCGPRTRPHLTLDYGHVDEGWPGRPLAANLRLSDDGRAGAARGATLLVRRANRRPRSGRAVRMLVAGADRHRLRRVVGLRDRPPLEGVAPGDGVAVGTSSTARRRPGSPSNWSPGSAPPRMLRPSSAGSSSSGSPIWERARDRQLHRVRPPIATPSCGPGGRSPA